MKRRVPRLATDKEAEAFLDSDLSDLDFSQFKSGRLPFSEDDNETEAKPGRAKTSKKPRGSGASKSRTKKNERR